MNVPHRATDPRLSGLDRAQDDAAMRDTLAPLLAREGARCGRVAHTVLKHTPGKRCVFEYRIETGGPAPLHLIGKLYRDDRGAVAFDNLERLWRAARDGIGLGMAEPIAYLPELGMMLQRRVAGEALGSNAATAEDGAAIERVADNLAALHGLPAELGTPRTLSDHVEKLCRPGPDRLIDTHPELAPQVETIVQRLATETLPTRRTLSHGDLGLGQIFVTGERAFFVDFDGLCAADPALDLANFVVSLRRRFGDGGQLERIFLERYLAHRPEEHARHLDTYLGLAYLRRAMSGLRAGAAAEPLALLLRRGAASVAGDARGVAGGVA